MKKWLLVSLICIFTSCGSNKTKNTDKYDYPGFGMLLDSYFFDYYEYPKNIDDFILYCNSIHIKELKNAIKKIKENRNSFYWILSNDKITIKIENNIVYETFLRYPCEELSYNKAMYSKYLFFNDKNILIVSNQIEKEFKIKLKTIKKKYTKVIKEKYLILEYTKTNKLSLFCDNSVDMSKYEYFLFLEKCLDVFSKKYNLNKIIFSTYVFYN